MRLAALLCLVVSSAAAQPALFPDGSGPTRTAAPYWYASATVGLADGPADSDTFDDYYGTSSAEVGRAWAWAGAGARLRAAGQVEGFEFCFNAFCAPDDDVVTLYAESPLRVIRPGRRVDVSASAAPSLVLELHTAEDDARALGATGTVSAAYFFHPSIGFEVVGTAHTSRLGSTIGVEVGLRARFGTDG